MSKKPVNDALDFMPANDTRKPVLSLLSNFAQTVGNGYRAGTTFRDLVDNGVPADEAVRQAMDCLGKKVA